MPYKDEVTRRKARQKSYRKRKDKILAQEREYRIKNPEAYKATRLRYRYGLSFEQYGELFRTQRGLCALCEERPAVVIDHCHKTQRVRGLLCHSCNVGLGLFRDDRERLLKAISYLADQGELT